jgi:hypothetical protein
MLEGGPLDAAEFMFGLKDTYTAGPLMVKTPQHLLIGVLALFI